MRQSRSRKSQPKGTHGVLVRMPVTLHEELREIAQRENRPVNGQIVYAIQCHVEERIEAEREKAAVSTRSRMTAVQ